MVGLIVDEIVCMDRYVQFVVVAVEEVFVDSGFVINDWEWLVVVLGLVVGGMIWLEADYVVVSNLG